MEVSGKLFRFKLDNEEFCLEIIESKKISLCRILDPIAEIAQVDRNEIAFLYNDKEIFSLDCLQPLAGTIMIHTPKTRVSSVPETSQLIPKSICKLIIELQDQNIETWSLAGKHPKISDFLSALYLDDEYKKIFTMKFDVFQDNKKIPKKKFINGFEDYSEFHLKPTPIQNPIKIIFDYPECGKIECIYDKNTKWKKLRYNIRCYLGIHKNLIFDFDDVSISLDDKGSESLEAMNLHQQVIKIRDALILTEKHFLNKIEFNPKAPDHRQVIPGLNLKCVCKVNDCILKDEFVMEKLGYGRYNYNTLKQNIRCKKCGNLVKILAFGIFKAYLKLNFYDSDKQYEQEFDNFEDYYVSFDFFMRKFKNLNEIWFESIGKQN